MGADLTRGQQEGRHNEARPNSRRRRRRKLGRIIGNRHYKKRGRGYAFQPPCHSRLAYSEEHHDERKETAAAFWERARAFFTARCRGASGFDRQRILLPLILFRRARPNVKHRHTRPYRPQTNGKVERFNRTLAAVSAYTETYLPDEARSATYQSWLHHYPHHRPHIGIGGKVTDRPRRRSQRAQELHLSARLPPAPTRKTPTHRSGDYPRLDSQSTAATEPITRPAPPSVDPGDAKVRPGRGAHALH
ncbi:hypothetical protein RW1_070_00200 [Rhodococcus wratislaviensis NBRC 100605]|uniref:Integrase catalytic domain-containing protein n=1 Tax=Rhodococcus wratislaviensis NBRC 100605 TaxID=1219028 RepID=X0PZQ0_RHOWR|nr:hypothetical protein RW1_070_00200 [Rhodococcus wratislaviensis NBRC 100605]